MQVIVEGRMLGKRGPGRKRVHRLDSLLKDCSYAELKHKMVEVKGRDWEAGLKLQNLPGGRTP